MPDFNDEQPEVSTDSLYKVLLTLAGDNKKLVTDALSPQHLSHGSGFAVSLPEIMETIVRTRFATDIPQKLLTGEQLLTDDQRDALGDRFGAPLKMNHDELSLTAHKAMRSGIIDATVFTSGILGEVPQQADNPHTKAFIEKLNKAAIFALKNDIPFKQVMHGLAGALVPLGNEWMNCGMQNFINTLSLEAEYLKSSGILLWKGPYPIISDEAATEMKNSLKSAGANQPMDGVFDALTILQNRHGLAIRSLAKSTITTGTLDVVLFEKLMSDNQRYRKDFGVELQRAAVQHLKLDSDNFEQVVTGLGLGFLALNKDQKNRTVESQNNSMADCFMNGNLQGLNSKISDRFNFDESFYESLSKAFFNENGSLQDVWKTAKWEQGIATTLPIVSKFSLRTRITARNLNLACEIKDETPLMPRTRRPGV